jgi:dTDP-4-amino-4,6-dideoxygalactose transaminase
LALHGGPRACSNSADWPPADEEVREALQRAFADGSWGSYHGRYCRQLSDALAAFFEERFVTLCCSGTFAVELALRAVGVSAGDEVILAGYDFPGNFRAIEAIGARPVLVDVDPDNWNFDVRLLEAAIGAQTKAVVASHLHGGLVPMRELVQIAATRGLAVVEDACQAAGATVQGQMAGTWGDVAVLSFGGSKLLTAGRGGALITDREDFHQRARLFCDRGNQAFPLSELQAAVLLPQLEKLPERNAVRAGNVARIARQIADVPLLKPLVNRADAGEPAYYKLGLRYNPAAASGATREDFLAAVQAEGVPLDAGFRGFALRSARRCRAAGELTQSRLAAERMMVLHHPILLEPPEVIDSLVLALHKVAWHFQCSSS